MSQGASRIITDMYSRAISRKLQQQTPKADLQLNHEAIRGSYLYYYNEEEGRSFTLVLSTVHICLPLSFPHTHMCIMIVSHVVLSSTNGFLSSFLCLLPTYSSECGLFQCSFTVQLKFYRSSLYIISLVLWKIIMKSCK